MSRRQPLPVRLAGTAFLTSDGDFHLLGRSRLRLTDVAHPFHGASSVDLDLASIIGLCRAYEPLLRTGLFFSHMTAARLLGIPLPQEIPLLPLDLASLHGHSPPRRKGIRGHQIAEVGVAFVHSLPVVMAAEVWCQLGETLCREDLVAAGDFLISGTRLPGGARTIPLCTREQLVAAAAAHVGKRGAKARAWALPRIRPGVDSRPETLTRLLLVAAGLPEPIIGMPVLVDNGRLTLHPDLALMRWRTVLEYEGDGHRGDARQFRRDIERRELLEAVSLRVIRVTSDDVFVHPGKFVARVLAVLAIRERELR